MVRAMSIYREIVDNFRTAHGALYLSRYDIRCDPPVPRLHLLPTLTMAKGLLRDGVQLAMLFQLRSTAPRLIRRRHSRLLQRYRASIPEGRAVPARSASEDAGHGTISHRGRGSRHTLQRSNSAARFGDGPAYPATRPATPRPRGLWSSWLAKAYPLELSVMIVILGHVAGAIGCPERPFNLDWMKVSAPLAGILVARKGLGPGLPGLFLPV